jgi:cystathionine gamma-synthase
MLFASKRAAQRCIDFVHTRDPWISKGGLCMVHLTVDATDASHDNLLALAPTVSAVLLPKESFATAKQYWQHSGDGISSRRAEFCHSLFLEGLLVVDAPAGTTKLPTQRICRGPKRYQRGSTTHADVGQTRHNALISRTAEKTNGDISSETRESSQFIEERYGRNLDIGLVANAKSAIRRRIAGSLVGEIDLTKALPTSRVDEAVRGVADLLEEDVYLYPCGMNSIFNAHQTLLNARGPLKSIMFGFPYVDTLKILEKFGPGCLFYGNGSAEDLRDLEDRLERGERYLALFCEFPGNPLLASPDLVKIRELADRYDFAVVVDETIGNFVNVHVLPHADIVVSSLTKVFAGECNVMGGSGILNPRGQYYRQLKEQLSIDYEDTYWAEDAIFMERNSRDFLSRIGRINRNAEMICDVLTAHPVVKAIYYPKFVASRPHYDACRTPNGGYGGLLSVSFHRKSQAQAFYDQIKTSKGPSLGTNFTLTSPYVLLAHYQELDWAAQFGVDPNLIRISVGLEQGKHLTEVFGRALDAAEQAP